MGIFQIWTIVSSSKSSLNFWVSQLHLSWRRSWETIKALSMLASSFGLGINWDRSRIHGSFHIPIKFPLPTKIQAPRDMICLVPAILLQIGEELLEIWWANQLPLTLYLARSRFMHGQSFLDGVHQAILGRRAWLNSNELLNPKPPYFWGQHKDDQAIGVKYDPDFDFGFH